MEKDRVQEERLAELKDKLLDREVLLIAPGKSSAAEREKIVQYSLQKNIITFSKTNVFNVLISEVERS